MTDDPRVVRARETYCSPEKWSQYWAERMAGLLFAYDDLENRVDALQHLLTTERATHNRICESWKSELAKVCEERDRWKQRWKYTVADAEAVRAELDHLKGTQ